MPHFPVGSDGKYIFPRLTAPYLRSLYYREPSPVVRELLWEVHRLRLLVLRADQLQETIIGACPPATQLVLDILRKELAGEPCIEEKKDWALKFFGPPKQSAYSRKRREGG